MEYRKFRANNILSIVINYVKRLHSGENNNYQPEKSDLINEVQKIHVCLLIAGVIILYSYMQTLSLTEICYSIVLSIR